jgi:hypothetical protein
LISSCLAWGNFWAEFDVCFSHCSSSYIFALFHMFRFVSWHVLSGCISFHLFVNAEYCVGWCSLRSSQNAHFDAWVHLVIRHKVF